ncbi:MAG: rod shape-determining protein MreD [Candidatus Neomarinimicrobiota bacterium]
MRWNDIIIQALLVWLLQLVFSDFLSINTIKPDFCVILILYWSIINGRTFGIISGFLFGLLIDFSGSGLLFGLSPLAYSITGYLIGSLSKNYSRFNSFYFFTFWIIILFFHFFIFCSVTYQGIWEIDRQLFWGKFFGTSIYTLSFAGILQFILPLDNFIDAKSR